MEMNTLLRGEASNPRTTMEKWISNAKDGCLIPRDKETLDIQDHELRDNEAPTTTNMAI